MKKCSKCGEWKLFSEFYNDKSHNDGLTSACKDCRKKHDNEYRKNNREYYIEYNRRYRRNNKQYFKEYDKKYYKNVNNNKRATIRSSLLLHKKKYAVAVTLDECMEMDNDYCYYCGCKLEWERGTGFTNCSPTIDRFNNENVLTKNNIVFACRACNSGKNSGTVEEYIERCKRVVANESNIFRK